MRQVLLSFCIIVLFGACVKPRTPKTFTPEFWNWSGTDPMSAIINDAPWLVKPGDAFYNPAAGNRIEGYDETLNGIVIKAANMAPGVYNLSKGNGANESSYEIPGGLSFKSLDAMEGQMKILENDGVRVKGLFYFNGTSLISGSTAKVTKGYFNVSSWNWTGTDPMSAEIDGAPWQAASASVNSSSPPYTVISGTNSGLSIGITNKNSFPVGEYDLFGVIDEFAVFSNVASGDNFSSAYTKVGRIKVTDNTSTHIKGLFYFHGIDQVTKQRVKVNKGYFNVAK